MLSTTHTRGGDPLMYIFTIYESLYYPHTWGRLYHSGLVQSFLEVLPTHVGAIQEGATWGEIIYSTTHTRGGDTLSLLIILIILSYYPHTWGRY